MRLVSHRKNHHFATQGQENTIEPKGRNSDKMQAQGETLPQFSGAVTYPHMQ